MNWNFNFFKVLTETPYCMCSSESNFITKYPYVIQEIICSNYRPLKHIYLGQLHFWIIKLRQKRRFFGCSRRTLKGPFTLSESDAACGCILGKLNFSFKSSSSKDYRKIAHSLGVIEPLVYRNFTPHVCNCDYRPRIPYTLNN